MVGEFLVVEVATTSSSLRILQLLNLILRLQHEIRKQIQLIGICGVHICQLVVDVVVQFGLLLDEHLAGHDVVDGWLVLPSRVLLLSIRRISLNTKHPRLADLPDLVHYPCFDLEFLGVHEGLHFLQISARLAQLVLHM